MRKQVTTAHQNEEYREQIGKFGKGKLNGNGQLLMDYCKENDLVLTNTLFNHKMAHRVTWEAPYREFSYRDGSTRRNPIRNQIDYAICCTQHRRFVTDSRSYSGMLSDKDQTSRHEN